MYLEYLIIAKLSYLNKTIEKYIIYKQISDLCTENLLFFTLGMM